MSKQNIFVDSETRKEPFWVSYIKRRIINKKNFLGFIGGQTGCLSGDTIINTNRNTLGRKFTIKKMYYEYHNNRSQNKHKGWNLNSPTYVRSYNNQTIQLHKIKDVVFSGNKEVWLLKLIDGKQIKATPEHKIMTKQGFKELISLTKEDEVMCDTLKPQRGNQKSFKLRSIDITVKFHPYKDKRHKTVEVHRLCYEAYINKLALIDFLDIIWNDEEKAKTLTYIDPSIYHIHHKDYNHYNNSEQNLECLTISEHFTLHAKFGESFKSFNQGIPKYIFVDSITKIGIEPTYDIICEEPYHNFVANGMVVHNSGKSWAGLSMCDMLDSTFSSERIVTSMRQLIKLINSGKLKEGSAILWDEAGIDASSKSWQSLTNKAINFLMQTFRHKRFILIFTSPYLDFIDASTRKLFHAEFLMHSIDYEGKKSKLKPYLIQYNSRNRKFYYKYLRVKTFKGVAPIKFWNIPKPPQALIDQYEAIKDKFTHDLNKELEYQLDEIENKKNNIEPKLLTPIQEKVLISIAKSNNAESSAKELGVSLNTIYFHIAQAKKKGFTKDNFAVKNGDVSKIPSNIG